MTPGSYPNKEIDGTDTTKKYTIYEVTSNLTQNINIKTFPKISEKLKIIQNTSTALQESPVYGHWVTIL